jgi:hypothetical protein
MLFLFLIYSYSISVLFPFYFYSLLFLFLFYSNFVYRPLQPQETVHFAHMVYLCVSFNSQNKDRNGINCMFVVVEEKCVFCEVGTAMNISIQIINIVVVIT